MNSLTKYVILLLTLITLGSCNEEVKTDIIVEQTEIEKPVIKRKNYTMSDSIHNRIWMNINREKLYMQVDFDRRYSIEENFKFFNSLLLQVEEDFNLFELERVLLFTGFLPEFFTEIAVDKEIVDYIKQNEKLGRRWVGMKEMESKYEKSFYLMNFIDSFKRYDLDLNAIMIEKCMYKTKEENYEITCPNVALRLK